MQNAPILNLEPRPHRITDSAGSPPVDLQSGERVFVVSLNQQGIVRIPPDPRGEAEVQAGTLRLRVPLTDLRRLPPDEGGGLLEPLPVQPDFGKALAISPTLALRGLRTEDAIEQLDKYLDDAALAGLARVTVIHGKGTGTLRQAVREHLSRHPEVAAFRLGAESEGGSGVTIVELRRP